MLETIIQWLCLPVILLNKYSKLFSLFLRENINHRCHHWLTILGSAPADASIIIWHHVHAWYSWPSDEPAPVHSQYSGTPCLSRVEVWPFHTSAPWLALVVGSGGSTYLTGFACLLLSSKMAPPYLARDLCWTDKAEALQLLYSGSLQWLVVPRIQLHSISDHSFCTMAAKAWNTRPAVSLQHLHWPCSKDNWKHSCFINLFRNYCVCNYVPCPRSYFAYATSIFTF